MAMELHNELKRRGLYGWIDGFAHGVKQVAVESFGWDGVKDEKGRRLLQIVGTEAGRAYNKNIWAIRAYETNLLNVYPLPNFLIFDDWRYPNEYEVWLDKPEVNRIFTIRCFRKEEQYMNHASEVSLPDEIEYYNYGFDNNCDMALIQPRVWVMLEKLRY